MSCRASRGSAPPFNVDCSRKRSAISATVRPPTLVVPAIDISAIRFSTSFGRGVDYYTGFEFELHRKGNGDEPLVAGGRYDGLMTQLGARNPIPAVGFSVWVETLTQVGRQRAKMNSGGSAS